MERMRITTAAERYAIKVLIDRAKRNKLIADGIRAGHGARLHGDIKPSTSGTFIRPAMPRMNFPVAEDEELLVAQEIEYGISTGGNMLPSQQRRAA